MMIALVLVFVGLLLLGTAGLSAAIDSGIMPETLLDALNRFCGNEGDDRF
ncbi:MAG: hypothetical protein LKG24_03440 [Lacticaseibacillus songhuajiangensis]|nr:hypothetical protein [Lacticaseibacillus songhuajiangensis]